MVAILSISGSASAVSSALPLLNSSTSLTSMTTPSELQRDAHLAGADQRRQRLLELFIGGVDPLDLLLDLVAQVGGGGRRVDLQAGRRRLRRQPERVVGRRLARVDPGRGARALLPGLPSRRRHRLLVGRADQRRRLLGRRGLVGRSIRRHERSAFRVLGLAGGLVAVGLVLDRRDRQLRFGTSSRVMIGTCTGVGMKLNGPLCPAANPESWRRRGAAHKGGVERLGHLLELRRIDARHRVHDDERRQQQRREIGVGDDPPLVVGRFFGFFRAAPCRARYSRRGRARLRPRRARRRPDVSP